jgi:quinol monooxygenase YgiN
MTEIEIVTLFKPKLDKLEDGRKLIHNLHELTLKEGGVLRYDLYVDKHDPNTYILIQKWASPEAFQAHRHSAHFLEAIEKGKELLEEAPQSRVLVKADY